MGYEVSTEIREALNSVLALDEVKNAFEYIEKDDKHTLDQNIELAMIEAPTFHEQEKCKRFIEMLKEAGISDVREGKGGNAIATIKGKGNTGKSVIMEAHIDTVFPFGTVKEPVITDEAVFLPGIIDDTRGMAEILSIARALKASGIELEHDLILAGTTREEGMGSLGGMKDLLEELSDKDIAACISIDGDNLPSIVYLGTGFKTVSVDFSAVGGHAYVNFGIANCLHAAGRFIAKLSDLDVPSNPKTTYCVSNFHAGTDASIHAIVSKANIKINYRSESAEELEALDAKIKQLIQEACDEESERAGTPGAVTWEMEVLCDVPACQQDVMRPIIQSCYASIEAFGLTPVLEGGICCNANISIDKGMPAICVSSMYREPGFEDLTLFHSTDERFYLNGSYKAVQFGLLLVLLNAGIHGKTEPVSK